MRLTTRGLIGCGVLSVFTLVAAADAAKPAEPAKQPSQEEMMAAWQKAATPGPEHAVLKNYEGKWSCKVTSTMDPAHPETSDGSGEGALELGGRYAHVSYKGTMMGQPFEGAMLLGYDNVAKKYVSAWIDNFGTSITHYEGSYNAAKKTLTMTGKFTDPMSGKPMRTKGVTTFSSADAMSYDEYMLSPDGKSSTKTLHIDYKRM